MTRQLALPAGLAAACVALLAVKAAALDSINVNWDEFLYLSRVHEHLRDDLATTFQTFHVHLFGWLPAAGPNEVDQVLQARAAMFGVRLASCVLLFAVALRLIGTAGAWFAVLASLAFSYMWRHGEAFRADPLLALLFLAGAAALVWRPGIAAAAVAGTAAAIALAVSVKAAVLLPATVVLLLCAPRLRAAPLRDALVFAATAAVGYAAMQLLHAAAVGAEATDAGVRAAGVGARMWLAPRTDYLVRTLGDDWPFWGLTVVGAIALAVRAAERTGDERARLLCVLGLLLPLASLALYRNTFPYFYVMLVPLAAVAAGWAAVAPSARRPLVTVAAAALLLAGAVRPAADALADQVTPQREVVAAVHAMFPDPVPYLDRGGMVASYPRIGPFMSTFVLGGYRARGVPRIEALVRDAQPAFLLANTPALDPALDWAEIERSPYALLPDDHAFIRRSFVHLWGPVWVPGARFAFPDGDVRAFTVAVPGRYAIDADGPVRIDGVDHAPGAVVPLAAGPHTIQPVGVGGRATLRRAAGPRPAARPPAHPLFISL